MFLACIFFTFYQCAPVPRAVDQESEKAAVMKADADWSAASSTVEGHLAVFADDAVVMAPDEMPVSGKGDISKMLEDIHGIPGLQLSWKPSSATVSATGDMAYTLGSYTFGAPDSTGQMMLQHGKYVTVWTKQDSTWKVAVDAFSPNAATH